MVCKRAGSFVRSAFGGKVAEEAIDEGKAIRAGGAVLTGKVRKEKRETT